MNDDARMARLQDAVNNAVLNKLLAEDYVFMSASRCGATQEHPPHYYPNPNLGYSTCNGRLRHRVDMADTRP
jgi:hypothetical protein